MLKDTAGTGGLKVLSMYVRTFGYGMSTVVETEGPKEMFETMWAVNMLNLLVSQTSFCSVILSHSQSEQKVSNPKEQKEQSFEVLADGHIKAMEESKIIRNSCRDKCGQCWQPCNSTRNTDHLQTTN